MSTLKVTAPQGSEAGQALDRLMLTGFFEKLGFVGKNLTGSLWCAGQNTIFLRGNKSDIQAAFELAAEEYPVLKEAGKTKGSEIVWS